MTTSPREIWLQDGGIPDDERWLAEITWCDEPLNKDDTRYILKRALTIDDCRDVPEVRALAEALKLALDYVEGCKVNNLPDLGSASRLPFIDDVLRIGDAALRALEGETK